MSHLLVRAAPGRTEGRLTLDGIDYRCALGRTGLTTVKREGDGGTPIGRFPLRQLMFRPDRIDPPPTRLPVLPLHETFGWCDDPDLPAVYNRLVNLPFSGSHERMWREDGLYDLVVDLGYNDDPPEPGLGSAIFLHVASDSFSPTEGCVALRRADLVAVLAACAADSVITIAADS